MSIIEQVRENLSGRIVDWQVHSPRRIYILIKPSDLKEAADILFRQLKLRFATASAEDKPKAIEILYHFSFDKTGEIFSLRVALENKEHPEIDSISPAIKGAEWIEREMWEMLGINFLGHPNLKRLLLAEEWPEGDYPLRHKP